MLGKRKTANMVPPPKRRKKTPAIEEISFDFGAREDYLTGFHKRKLQRIKHAQEEAVKKEREERIAARKRVSGHLRASKKCTNLSVKAEGRPKRRPQEARGSCELGPPGGRWQHRWSRE